MTHKRIPVISLFSGAMGLDLGIEKAGFEVVLAVECDKQAVATIKRNRPRLPVIDRRIEHVTTDEILQSAGVSQGGQFIVAGGPSCQAFSTAGQRLSLTDPRGGLFREFVRVVKEANPKFFIMENVKGMLSAAVKHRPLKKRGPGFPPLEPEEELGSAFQIVIKELKTLNYYVVFDVLNAADYGVPQMRERLFFIGSRNGQNIAIPPPTHSKEQREGTHPWVTLGEAIEGLQEHTPVGWKFGLRDSEYLALVPEGGNWRNLPLEIQKEALGKAYVSWGGRSGFFRRLSRSKPSPALTTCPDSKATMLCHPTELRPLSIREYARIQQFPDQWVFEGTTTSLYRQIGNAVPVGLGEIIGKAVRLAWDGPIETKPTGVIEAHNEKLVLNMAKRPVTILNPTRMRVKITEQERIECRKTKITKRVHMIQYLQEI